MLIFPELIMHKNLICIFSIFLCILKYTTTLSEFDMFPYGPQNGDITLAPSDDGFSRVTTSINFPFFGTSSNQLYVNTNGLLTFDAGLSEWKPQPFPTSEGAKIIAPYWADVDTTAGNNGRVFYRQSVDPQLLTTGSAQVRNFISNMQDFQATWMFVATWSDVTFFGGNINSPINTFQCALITDGNNAFAIFNYLKITWTTGNSDGGDTNGLGGTPAQVGFDAGNGVNFFALPQSMTNDVVNIGSQSNLSPTFPGKFMFRINGETIENLPTVMTTTCTAVTDPHFTTFDGAFLSPQEPPGLWYLATSPVNLPIGTFPWSVWFRTSYWDNNQYASCITSVEIYMYNHVIEFGMNGLLKINGLDTIAPWYYPSSNKAIVTVVRYGLTGHILFTSDMVKVSFSGTIDYALTILTPAEIYRNSAMHGICGNMNGNPDDDLICPDGGNIDICWQRYEPSTNVKPQTTSNDFSETTVDTNEASTQNADNASLSETMSNASAEIKFGVFTEAATDSTSDKSNDVSSLQSTSSGILESKFQFVTTCDSKIQDSVEEQCSIIIDPIGPFQTCSTISANFSLHYHESCLYDLCTASSNTSTALCSLLQSYADACMRHMPSIILKWRSESLCFPNCSSHMHYDSCASSCPATCSNPNGPLICPLPCRGDCTCDNGYVLDGGQCVLPNQCTTDTENDNPYGLSFIANRKEDITCGLKENHTNHVYHRERLSHCLSTYSGNRFWKFTTLEVDYGSHEDSNRSFSMWQSEHVLQGTTNKNVWNQHGNMLATNIE